MAFEKKVLNLAKYVGIEDAYFAYGSMFIPIDSVGRQEIARFVCEYAQNFNGRAQVTLGDQEVAVDFVLN